MKSINIECPKNHIIDVENSNLEKGIIKFKEVAKEVTTYCDVAEKLFKDEGFFYTDSSSHIEHMRYSEDAVDPNSSTTEAQLESILALNKLCNVAKYLNEDWLPDFSKRLLQKYIICMDEGVIKIYNHQIINEGSVCFKSKELAEQAVKILGESEIRTALTLNH